jgi:RNA polymerase sigma-70 factor (ECF subfamily)
MRRDSWYAPLRFDMGKSVTPRARRLDFEQAALSHLDALYTAALRLTRTPHDAADLVQETVLRAYRYFHQFTPGTNCRAWLLTIMYNLFRTAYRRGLHEQVAATTEEFEREVEAHSLSESSANKNPEDLLADRTDVYLIRKALEALPEEFRETLLLVDLHELNYHEAAEVLKIPIGTVKSRVSRGRGLLRVVLTKLAIKPGKTGT